MKKVLSFLLLASLPVPFCGFTNNNDHLPFIEIKYVGPSNKPLPAVVFYLDDKFDTLFKTFTYCFKISQKEFDSVNEYINSNMCDPNVNRRMPYFKFIVNEYDEDSFFITNDKPSTEKKLFTILSFIETGTTKRRIKEVIEKNLNSLL